jgi:phosphomannomutase/phosphoglucomutase
MNQLPAEIFKAYDIRGIVGKSLTADVVRRIGHALGSLAARAGPDRHRRRPRRPPLRPRAGRRADRRHLRRRLRRDRHRLRADAGHLLRRPRPRLRLLRLGHRQPQPARLQRPQDGHRRHDAGGDAIQQIKRAPSDGDLARQGRRRDADVKGAYIERIVGDVKLARPMKIVMDCGNGVAGAVAPELFRRLGCEVVELFCEVDGNFPNHHPDPSKPENLADVIRALRETDAEIGIAFDGDGDRLGVVTKDGEIIYPDRQLMLFAADVLARVPGGQIIYDVKCTRNCSPRGSGARRRAADVEHRPRAGQGQAQGDRRPARRRDERPHLLQGALVRLRRRPLRRRPPARDPLALGRRRRAAEIAARFAVDPGTQPQDGRGRALRADRQAQGRRPLRRRDRKDHHRRPARRIPDGFGLARPSNTTPVVVLRFEADNAAALARIQGDFQRAITAVWPGVEVPF